MNEVVMTIFIILFPGVIAALVVENFLNYSPKWTSFKFSIFAFVLGVASYAILELFMVLISLFPNQLAGIKPLYGGLDVWKFPSNGKQAIDIAEVLCASTLAPFIGAFVTRLANDRNWFFLKKLSNSKKYGNENLFSNFLASKDLNYVYIRDYDLDLMYEGAVASFSENDHIQEIVLENVRVFRNHDSEHLEDLPSIYISKKAGTFIIEDAPELEVEAKNA